MGDCCVAHGVSPCDFYLCVLYGEFLIASGYINFLFFLSINKVLVMGDLEQGPWYFKCGRGWDPLYVVVVCLASP